MDKFYTDALMLARSAGCLENRGGMASVKVSYNPYDCHWEGEANWSSNNRLVGEGADTPMDAILNLIQSLEEELAKNRQKGRVFQNLNCPYNCSIITCTGECQDDLNDD